MNPLMAPLAEKAVLSLLEAGLDALAKGVAREDILDTAAKMRADGKSYDEITAGIRALAHQKVDALDKVVVPPGA